jgi:hypothetical protein
MAQHFESLTVYEKMDLLMNVSNSIKKDIEKRLVLDNPDLVEMQENRWVYDMIFVLPHHLRIEQLKALLIKFDKEIKYGEQ